LGWSADHPDPDNFFTPILSCSASKIGNNRTFWCNKEYDELLKMALNTTNMSKRKKYYAEAMRIVYEEAPLLAIAHSKRFQARGTDVSGKILSNFGGITFQHVSKVPVSTNAHKTTDTEHVERVSN